MLSYYLGIKAHFWDVCGNNNILSKDESHWHEPNNLKNSWQATVYMGSLTNKKFTIDLSLDFNNEVLRYFYSEFAVQP